MVEFKEYFYSLHQLDELIKLFPRAKWLTVGDGKFGTDAYFLQKRGLDVTASDINPSLLEIAYKEGYLKKYSEENAEKLSFENDSFDFVLCRDAYHHFPRPYVAVYEMLRVAKIGVVLIEPIDGYINSSLFEKILIFLRNTLLKHPRHTYEDSGNYVYKVSKREFEKIALGVRLPYLAFKGINFNISLLQKLLPVRKNHLVIVLAKQNIKLNGYENIYLPTDK